MQAAVITAANTLEISQVPDPTPAADEVVLEVAAAGICGTDLQIVAGNYPNAQWPLIPGHEFSGRVVAVGHDVHDLRVGDRVTADPNIPCRRCHFCHEGRVNLCENFTAIGINLPGAAAQYLAVPEHLCVTVPLDLPLEYAALTEPLSCAVHAWDRIGPQSAKRAAIYGSGTMGLMMLQLAAGSGVISADVIDTNDRKLQAARELGARHTTTNADEAMPDRGWDLVIDATGAGPAIADGLRRTAKGGTFVQFGVASPDTKVEIDPFIVYEHELTIIGSICPLHSFARAARLLAAGVIDAEKFISHRYPIASFEEALTTFAQGASRKILITPAG